MSTLVKKTFLSGFSCLFNMLQVMLQGIHYSFCIGKCNSITTFLVLPSPSFAALGTSSINNPCKMLLFPFTGPSLPPLSTQDALKKRKGWNWRIYQLRSFLLTHFKSTQPATHMPHTAPLFLLRHLLSYFKRHPKSPFARKELIKPC